MRKKWRIAFVAALSVSSFAAAAAIGCGSKSTAAANGVADSGGSTPVSDGAGIAMGPGSTTDDAGADAGCVHGPFPSPDIYDEHCNFDLTEYRKLAQSLGTDDGLSYRLGPTAAYYHSTPQVFPLLPRLTTKICGQGPLSGPPPGNITYQIGNNCSTTDPGNYSDDQAVVLYNTNLRLANDAGPLGGVDNIGIQSFVYNTFDYHPGPAPDLGDPTAWQPTSKQWEMDSGVPIHSPVAVARGISPTYGQTSQCAYIAFNDGQIGLIGTSTENGNGMITAVPNGLVPTAVGLPNGNEFLLVTMWDPANVKSQLGVFSIEADHLNTGDLDDIYKYDFKVHLPGYMNTGEATTIKYLGAIDLPGMIAPTDIAVASNMRTAFLQMSGNAAPGAFDFSMSEWSTFADGGANSGVRSTAGFAMIGSRSERKVIFVDLQPLFEAFNHEYFSNYTTYQMTQTNWGPMPNQWPFTFDVQPNAKPVVVATISTSEIPTALYAGRYGESDATKAINGLVATMDGTLHIFQLGGLMDTTAADASDIKEIGTMKIGNNPVQIADQKNHPQDVLVVSRGDRTISFVNIQGSAGTFTQQIQDSALIDPVYADEADNESFTSYVVSIADLKGKQIVNYRYDAITFPSDHTVYPLPTGPDGGPEIECGGSYSVRGEPFAVSGTNVP